MGFAWFHSIDTHSDKHTFSFSSPQRLCVCVFSRWVKSRSRCLGESLFLPLCLHRFFFCSFLRSSAEISFCVFAGRTADPFVLDWRRVGGLILRTSLPAHLRLDKLSVNCKCNDTVAACCMDCYWIRLGVTENVIFFESDIFHDNCFMSDTVWKIYFYRRSVKICFLNWNIYGVSKS